MLVSCIGNILCASVVCLVDWSDGLKYHVGFPMWNRIVWGIRASYFPVSSYIPNF